MELWRLRTLLLATFLLMTMTWDFAHSEGGGDRGPNRRRDGNNKKKKKDGKSLDVEPILQGVIQGNRRVLLLAAFLGTSIAIVSGNKIASLRRAAIVDITLKDKKVFFNSAMLLKDKWPQVNMPKGMFLKLALIHDDTGYSVLIADKGIGTNNQKLWVLSLANPSALVRLPFQPQTYERHFSVPMFVSSVKLMAFYGITPTTNIVSQDNFSGHRLADTLGMSINSNQVINQAICTTGDQFTLQDSPCPTGQTAPNWWITTGFSSETDVFLLDRKNQQIVTFKGSFQMSVSTKFSLIDFADFWKKGKKPKKDAPPGPAAPGNDSIRFRLKSSTSSHKGYWIAAGVVLLVILILALVTAGVALYMCGKSKKKDKAAAAAAAAAASKSKEGVKKKASKHKEHHKMAVIVVQSKQNAAAGKVASKGSVQNVGKKPSKRSQQSKRRKASSGQMVSKKYSKRAASSR